MSVTVDLGGQKKLDSVSIQWEFPAKSFKVSVSTDGTKWSEVHATDSNILSSSSIALGSAPAAKVRVVMHEAGFVCVCVCLSAASWAFGCLQAAGSFHGHAVYGIRSLVVRAARLQSIVEDCAAAAKSTDARDKYFATYVDEFAPCSSKALRSELPSLADGDLTPMTRARARALACVLVARVTARDDLSIPGIWFEAARASVASAVSELAEVLPKLGSCRGAALFVKSAGALTRQVATTCQGSSFLAFGRRFWKTCPIGAGRCSLKRQDCGTIVAKRG